MRNKNIPVQVVSVSDDGSGRLEPWRPIMRLTMPEVLSYMYMQGHKVSERVQLSWGELDFATIRGMDTPKILYNWLP
jgi:hypothetical protein